MADVQRSSPDPLTQTAEVSAQYGARWIIYRDLCRDGTHDEWVAEPRYPTRRAGEKIIADDIGALAEQLAAAEA